MVKKLKIVPCIVQNNRPTNKTAITTEIVDFFTQIDSELSPIEFVWNKRQRVRLRGVKCSAGKLSASQRGEFASKEKKSVWGDFLNWI